MSKPVDLGALTILLGLSSAMLAACDSAPQGHGQSANWRVCVDAQGRRVVDAQCAGGAASGGHGGWAYYGGGRRVPAVGEVAADAAHAPAGGTAYAEAPTGGVARGGFGATGEGHGGGGEGGAGE